MACTLRLAWSYTPANKYIPRIEYRYSSKNKRPPTFASDGMASTKVLKILRRDLYFLMILRILPILKALITVVYGPTLTLLVSPTMKPI